MKISNNPRLEFLVKSFAGILFTAAILFLSAGTLDWRSAWAYLGVFALVSVVTVFVVDPGLIAERNTRRHPDQKPWDRAILGIYGLVEGLLIPLFAGLSIRFEWKPEASALVQYLALLVVLLGWAIHVWAMAANRFFAQVVRIQDDRGQTVATAGPYRWMRHPGYLGGILLTVATPLMLGSYWTVLVGLTGAILLVVRTALEDRDLRAGLPGYQDYSQRVRWKLIPGIW